jgi:hypothetical protein
MSHETEIDADIGEVLFEVMVMGNAVKVSALDPATNTEVCVVGSAYASPYTLKMNALRKLKSVLRRNAAHKLKIGQISQ